MLVSRVLSRISRKSGWNHCREIISSRQELPQILSNNFHSIRPSILSTNERVAFQGTGLRHELAIHTTSSQRFWYSSSVSPEPADKEGNTPAENEDGKAAENLEKSDSEDDLSMDDMVKLVAEKEELLTAKQTEMEKMKDKFLRSYAEIENVMERTKRDAENSKKFAIQSFAKSLLDVADNLGRASSVVKESFSKIDTSKDTAGAVPLLKTLLEGVEMTEKQLADVFGKFGVEKFDPLNEQFDPNRHHALFQIPDGSKPSGTVAAVLKPGYTLHDRIIRPAEVGVTEAVNGEEAEQKSEA